MKVWEKNFSQIVFFQIIKKKSTKQRFLFDMNINTLTRKCFIFWYIFILETDMNKN